MTHSSAPESLTLDGISVAREGVSLIDRLSLTATPGDIWLVEGANGSGKSTLLRAIAGLHPLEEGAVKLGEGALTDHPAYPGCIAWLGHKRGIKQSMSVEDNVSHWARMQGVPENVELALEYFDLTPYRDMACRELSAGWQERVALTRLLTSQARIWLLDEPMAHLDEQGAALVQALIVTRVEQGGIVFMSTHARIESNKVKRLNLNSEVDPLDEEMRGNDD